MSFPAAICPPPRPGVPVVSIRAAVPGPTAADHGRHRSKGLAVRLCPARCALSNCNAKLHRAEWRGMAPADRLCIAFELPPPSDGRTLLPLSLPRRRVAALHADWPAGRSGAIPYLRCAHLGKAYARAGQALCLIRAETTTTEQQKKQKKTCRVEVAPISYRLNQIQFPAFPRKPALRYWFLFLPLSWRAPPPKMKVGRVAAATRYMLPIGNAPPAATACANGVLVLHQLLFRAMSSAGFAPLY